MNSHCQCLNNPTQCRIDETGASTSASYIYGRINPSTNQRNEVNRSLLIAAGRKGAKKLTGAINEALIPFPCVLTSISITA